MKPPIPMDKKFKQPTCISVGIRPHQQNHYYEVVTHDYYDLSDDLCRTYFSRKEALANGVEECYLGIQEHYFSRDIRKVYKYEYSFRDPVNHMNAIKCDLGVIRGMKGPLEGNEFMFPLYEAPHIEVNLLCYAYLTHGFVDKKNLKIVQNDEELRTELSLIGEGKLYKEMMNLKV